MLPEDFASVLPKNKHQEVVIWWETLDKHVQDELTLFYNEGEQQVVTLVDAINGELEDRSNILFEADRLRDIQAFEFPNQDYYENLIGNEVYLCLRGPVFHICKAHKKLRLYLLLGLLPSYYKCFIGADVCVMENNLRLNESGYWRLKLKSRS